MGESWKPGARSDVTGRRTLKGCGAAVLLLLAALAALPTALPGAAAAQARGPAHHRVPDPLIGTNGSPVPCPDSDALVLSRHPYRVEIDCTTDRNEGNPPGSAFTLYKTSNLRQVTPDGYIFPPGHEPWWAQPSPRGEYWGPTIMHIGKNYVAYFAADPNPSRVHLIANGQAVTGMALGVAWGTSLHNMYRHTRALHYIGQFNDVRGNTLETYGGAIDPSVETDPLTGQLYVAYCEQPNRLMVGTLTPNGLAMNDRVHMISYATYPWEGTENGHPGVEEGPVLVWNSALKAMTVIANTAGTWSGTYKQAYLVGFNPAAGLFAKFDQPIFQSGSDRFGPGMGSKPFLGPDGKREYVYMAEQLRPNHYEMRRYLALEPYESVGPHDMLIQVFPHTPVTNLPVLKMATGTFVKVPVPQIGNGRAGRAIVMARRALVTIGR